MRGAKEDVIQHSQQRPRNSPRNSYPAQWTSRKTSGCYVLENMSNVKKQFAFNAASGWIAHLVFAVVGFILMPYCINRLGEQGFGVYQLARSALGFLCFCSLGWGRHWCASVRRPLQKATRSRFERSVVPRSFYSAGWG